MRQWLSHKVWHVPKWLMRFFARFTVTDDITGGREEYSKYPRPQTITFDGDIYHFDGKTCYPNLEDHIIGKTDDITGGNDGK